MSVSALALSTGLSDALSTPAAKLSASCNPSSSSHSFLNMPDRKIVKKSRFSISNQQNLLKNFYHSNVLMASVKF